MQHVEEFVYRHSGLGLGLAALGWTEGANPAIEHCSDAAREQWLEPLMAGEITAAFANTEISVGTDVLAMETRARRDGSDWILDGTKAWITNAHFADVVQVTAVTEPGAGTRSLSMFLVDATAPGFSRGRDIPTMLDDGLTGELHLDGVRVPAENVVGEVGDGFALAMAWINWRRLCRGGMCAGWGEWLLARAIDRARERTSGGRPIAELQAVQHMLADMDADVYAARAASLQAQAELDAMPGGAFAIPLHADAPRLMSLVKVINDEAFFRVADRAVQVHGGTGLRLGSPEEKLFRLARNLKIPAGTVEIQRNAIARGLLRRGRTPPEVSLRSPDASSPSTTSTSSCSRWRSPSTTTSSSPSPTPTPGPATRRRPRRTVTPTPPTRSPTSSACGCCARPSTGRAWPTAPRSCRST